MLRAQAACGGGRFEERYEPVDFLDVFAERSAGQLTGQYLRALVRQELPHQLPERDV